MRIAATKKIRRLTAPALCSFPMEKNDPPPRLADGARRADRTAMNRFRKEVLFFCDAVIFAAAVAFFLLVYTVFDYAEVGPQSGLLRHVVLLYACTVFFQLLFKTYDSCVENLLSVPIIHIMEIHILLLTVV